MYARRYFAARPHRFNNNNNNNNNLYIAREVHRTAPVSMGRKRFDDASPLCTRSRAMKDPAQHPTSTSYTLLYNI
jgi:hypothetical protein